MRHRDCKTIRGEDSDQPLTRLCAPGIRRWRAPVRRVTLRGEGQPGQLK